VYVAENASDYGCASCVMLRESDDLRLETCWSDFKCFNVKFYVCALVGVLIK